MEGFPIKGFMLYFFFKPAISCKLPQNNRMDQFHEEFCFVRKRFYKFQREKIL